MSDKSYKDGKVYEDGIYRGPIGGSGFVYPYREALKKYWPIALLNLYAIVYVSWELM